ncbi:putative deoxyribonuclease TATDN3 [Liolophura sinensis]|uniref:putative deoxyribonuclease TATDN3 n=1 Tax=Liolophura sinensis TaxID=3198878 RepID=UPI003158E2D9
MGFPDCMIDCHCHIADPQFNEDVDDVIQKAREANVKGIVAVPEFPSDFINVIAIADRYPDIILPCLGLHPVQEAKEDGKHRSVTVEEFERVVPLIEKHHGRIGGVGEVGLDFLPKFVQGENDKDAQRKVFKCQIDLAKKYDLPLNVHSRSAGKPVVAWLKEHGAEKVLLHAFDGRSAVALEGVQAGYFFSIPPCALHSPQKQKLIEVVPIDNLLLETDSPVLGPDKHIRNVPSNVVVSCDIIAKTKCMDPADVRRITSENALKLFPRLKDIIEM